MIMTYDCIVVGGGIAGLTAAAYTSRANLKTLLIEKEDKVGGLVSSFPYKDYIFDGGIRSIENSGIVRPMLNQLGIKVDFLPSTVSIGVEDEVVRVTSKESVDLYQEMLIRKFPNNKEDVRNIIAEIKKIMRYLDILYGIDNPLFFDVKTNKKFYLTTVLPWVFKYAFTYKKIERLQMPVDEYLKEFTDNQSLIDVIGQHFFYKTPAFFALSYFSLFLDYKYPRGGTGSLIKAMEDYNLAQGTDIQTSKLITYVNSQEKYIEDSEGNRYEYEKLIWASDNRSLYQMVDLEAVLDVKEQAKIKARKGQTKKAHGGDSIVTVYLGTNLSKEYYSSKCTGHFFYTPLKDGLNDYLYKKDEVNVQNKDEVLNWLKGYFTYNTYEIAIPGLRDPSLAPKGKTGLVVSTLMDYRIVKGVEEEGWYKEFKDLCESYMIEALNQSIFKDFKDHIELQFSSTPLTIEHRTNNTDGAITGWGFDNEQMPAVTSLPGIAKSSLTPIKDVYQAGAWSYSPSGLPISILTGKLAADKVIKTHKN
jgi:phytoene dehydrogenase-like protein